ncbi:hypothetical protein M408DRAFT_145986 [Serendipita vermifera MAFF 305830]|uniref:Actin-like ATPase domain-containing protein n=1 Tax=Serendipita vermifera MAFF 305830 TaxID=933852 RepID=A0A0C3A6E8_SERVB|nr:hypothetical protein M408DRAFT_145986 [Serendipita vermifera MAFF 305830]
MPVNYVEEVYKGPEKFLVSMDIGTTQSAVSFAHFAPGTLTCARIVTHWPGQVQSSGEAKIPTVVSYHKGLLRACGEEAISDLEHQDMNVAQWFKLHIHPSTMMRTSHFVIPEMPPGVSVERAYSDMMRYLMDNTQSFFERTTQDGDAIWARLRDKMIIIQASPNGWGIHEQKTIRTAAVRAGIVSRGTAEQMIRFIPEAEAAVHYALARYSDDWLEVGTTFAVVDAGGSTVDTTVYQCTSIGPLGLREACPSECVQAGGIFVNRAVEKLLSDRLRGSRFDGHEIMRRILEFFEKELKPKFDGSQDSYQIRFGSIKDTEQDLRISKGRITIAKEDLKAAFDTVVDRIITCCTNTLRNHKAKYILLVGGFGESPYLQRRLSDKFLARGTNVIAVGDYSGKAVAEGATIGYIKKLVKARATKVTFGGCVRELYDQKLHGSRNHCTYIDADGKRRVDHAFHPWVIKGTILEDDFAQRLNYHKSWDASSITKDDLASQLSKITAEVYAWEGDGPIPRWCKDEKGIDMPGMRLVCALDANLSPLASSLTITSDNGVQFYRVNFDVCVYFGGTSPRASLEWREDGDIRHGIAAMIPYVADED